jgi:hypothetical protein
MERLRFLTRSGQVYMPPRYLRPEGYSLTGDSRLSNVQWRRSWLERELGAELDMVESA